MSASLFGETSGARYAPLDRQDQPYRTRLWRSWGADPGKRVVFVMLNPSTATAEQDDPTIRRCIGFAKAWGYDALDVVNLFALRSTDPRALYDHASPVSPPEAPEANDDEMRRCARAAARVVCAWGNDGALLRRGAVVVEMLRALGGPPVECIAQTKTGQPRHPLYMPKTAFPVAFAGPVTS